MTFYTGQGRLFWVFNPVKAATHNYMYLETVAKTMKIIDGEMNGMKPRCWMHSLHTFITHDIRFFTWTYFFLQYNIVKT